jgi:regulator of replication initiation timing
MIENLEPLLEMLMQETPQEKAGSGSGGPEATPERPGSLNPGMRGAVISALCTFSKTVRELAANVETLKDENKAVQMERDQLKAVSEKLKEDSDCLRKEDEAMRTSHNDGIENIKEENKALQAECEQLRTAQKVQGSSRPSLPKAGDRCDAEGGRSLSEACSQVSSPLKRQPSQDGKATGISRGRSWRSASPKATAAAVSAPPAWPCPSGWSMPTASADVAPSRRSLGVVPVSGDPVASGCAAPIEDGSDASQRMSCTLNSSMGAPLAHEPASGDIPMGDSKAKHNDANEDPGLTPSARMAAFNDDLGKALLKLQRSSD